MKNYKLRFDAEMEISQIKNAVSEIQKYFSQISLPKGLASSFEKDLTRLREEFSKLENFKAKGLTGDLSPVDANKIAKSYDVIFQKFGNLKGLLGELSNISGINPEKLFPSEIITKIEGATDAIKAYNSAVSESKGSEEYKRIADEIAKAERQFKEYIAAKEKAEKSRSQASGRVSFLEEQVNKQKEIEKTAKEQAKIAEDEVVTLKKQIEAKEKIAEITKKIQTLEKKNQTDEAVQAEREAKGKTETRTYITTAADISSRKETINQLNQEKQTYEQLAQNAEDAEKRIGEATKIAEERARAASQATKDLGKTMDSLGTERGRLALATADIQSNSEAAEEAKQSIGNFGQELKTLEEKAKATALKALNSTLQELGVIGKENSLSFDEIQTKIDSLKPDTIATIKQNLENAGISLEKFGINLDGLKGKTDVFKETSEGVKATNSQLEMLKSRITYFFGLANSVQLFRQAVIKAMASVKELDAAMTEIAVVTDFSVGDMWDKLPEYTENANELGVAVKDLYNATGLYYQQGLKGNKVMQMGIETMKMARIAGMDAADATKAMTAAVRGFNMEINEASAQKVNDVYSQLAAMTATDTKGIADAMSKTASIAYSANMELEATAALLAQIIETTQESPETAGTAMKTIIARFTEVKELFSEGQLTGKDTEGEEININRIDAALKTVGISLKDFLNGSKGIDDIFLELAQKWDTLDLATQRYIATAAAGSRQQSRFIAMMQDYDRTMELVSAANNSAGASQEQYEKTLESMETLLTKLKNAWQEFLTGIANNEVLKFGVKTLTGILNIANKLTGSLPGLAGSLAKLGLAWGSLKLGGTILEKGLKSIIDKTGLIKGTKDAVAEGQVEGNKKGVKASIPSVWKDIKNAWYTAVKAGITQGTTEASATSAVASKNNITGNTGKWVRGQESYDTFLTENEYSGKKYYSTKLQNLDKKSKNSNTHSKIQQEYDAWLKQKQLEEQKLLAQQQANVAQETTNIKKELILTNEKGEAVKIDGIASIEELKTAQDEKKTTFIEIAADEKEYEAAVIEYQKALSEKGIDNVQFSRVDKAAGQTDISARVAGSSKTGFKQGVTGIKSSAKQKWAQLTSGGTKWGLGTMAGGAVAGGIAGGIAGNWIGEQITKNVDTAEEKMSSISTSLGDFTESLSKVQDTVDTLDDVRKSFTDLNKTLKNSIKGSSEYTSALIKNNEQFFKIQEDFDLLGNQNYYSLDNGVYSITEAGWEAYATSQMQEMQRLAAQKQQVLALQSSTKLEQAGLSYAEEQGIKTSEVTSAEEKNIKNWSTGTGAVVGTIAGAIAAGAAAGTVGGPIGVAIGAIAGLIIGGISAAVAGSAAYENATKGISADTINAAAIEAGERGLVGSSAYSGDEYDEYLKETSLRLGISYEQLDEIIQSDTAAFSEHVISAQKASTEMLALAESTAKAQGEMLGLRGDALEAYVEEYKRLFGDRDQTDVLEAYKNQVKSEFSPVKDKNLNQQIEWKEVRDYTKELKEYAEIMGYEYHPEDAENLFGEGIELPTYQEIIDTLGLDRLKKALQEEALSWGGTTAEAFARGLLEGTSDIGDVQLGDIEGIDKALEAQKEYVAIASSFQNDFVKGKWLTGSEEDKVKLAQDIREGKIKGIASYSLEEQDWIKGYNKYLNNVYFSNKEFSGLFETVEGAPEIKDIESLVNAIATEAGYDAQGKEQIKKELEEQGLGFVLDNYSGLLQRLDVDVAEAKTALDNIDIWAALKEGLNKPDIESLKNIKNNLNSKFNDLFGSDLLNTFAEQINELNAKEAQVLTSQLQAIPAVNASAIGKLMKEVMEETDKEFDEILGLGLNPEAIYEYATALEQNGQVSTDGAAAIRKYARELEKLNLGFSTLTLEQARKQLSGWQSWQQKIADTEPGEKLYFTEEEVSQMISESKGAILASDFRQTAEGFEFTKGLDVLNDTLQNLIVVLSGQAEGISQKNYSYSGLWNSLGIGNTYKDSAGGYVVRDYTGGTIDLKNTNYDIAISQMNHYIENGMYAFAAMMERSINNEIANAEEGSSYYGKTQTHDYQQAVFTEQDFAKDATWSAVQMDAMQDLIQSNWENLDDETKKLFVVNGESIIGEYGQLLDPEENAGVFQDIISEMFTNRNWSEIADAYFKQSLASSHTAGDLLKAISTGELKAGETDYAQQELDRRFEEQFGYGEDSTRFREEVKAAFGVTDEEYEEALNGQNEQLKKQINLLKAHQLSMAQDKKECQALSTAMRDNKDELAQLSKQYKEQGGKSLFTDDQRKTWDAAFDKAKEVFGDGLTEEFFAENMKLFTDLGKGGEIGEQAFEKIADMLNLVTQKELEAKYGTEDYYSALAMLEQFGDVEIGGTADFTQIFDTLASLGWAFEDIKHLFSTAGWELETKWVWADSTTGQMIEGIRPNIDGNWQKVKIVTGIKGKDSAGSYAGPTDTSASGGGGGSNSAWENPYDPSYNTLREINAELRERERLERAYQNLLDKESTSYKDLAKNAQARLDNIAQEIALQEQLRSERESQISDLIADNSEYSDYVKVNADMSDFTIDWHAIEALEGENISEDGQKFREGLEDYISKLEEWFDSIYDVEKEQNELLDEQKDILDNARDKYIEAQDVIKEAILSSYQEQIDELSKINDSINDANSNLLNAIQSSVEQIRQDRENERKEQELSDKERRLAYLRQDTSGGNTLEILELEKELAEGREDYTDSLVDQKIDELSRQNDEAAEQRERQIELMQEQRDYLERSGLVFDIVERLYSDMFNEDGTINWDSEGAKLLQDQADAMSKEAHMKWMEETEGLLAEGMTYLELLAGQGASAMLGQGGMQYNKNYDYMAAIQKAGSDEEAAQLEQYRNFKIASEGRTEDMTYTYEDTAREGFDQLFESFVKDNGDKYTSIKDYIDNFLVAKKGYAPFNENTDYMAAMIQAVEAKNWQAAAVAELYRNYKIDSAGLQDYHKTYAFYKHLPAFKTGGVADFTGPAWLDGTKSRPEMILNQRDTQNFIQLKDILGSLLNGNKIGSSESNGDIYYDIDINVERISSDYDIDEVVSKIKQTIYEDASYRNVNTVRLSR